MSQFVALKERRDRVGERRPMKDRVTGDGDGDDGGTGQPGGGGWRTLTKSGARA